MGCYGIKRYLQYPEGIHTYQLTVQDHCHNQIIMNGMRWNYTDEVEKTERTIMVKDVRKLLRYLYGDLIELSYRNTLQSRCNGCVIDHPSQSQHSCLETFDIVDGTPGATELYIEAESKVSKFYLNLLFIETCNLLWLDYSVIHVDNTLIDFLESWVANDFEDLGTRMDVEDAYSTASDAAATKIGLLKKRFTK